MIKTLLIIATTAALAGASGAQSPADESQLRSVFPRQPAPAVRVSIELKPEAPPAHSQDFETLLSRLETLTLLPAPRESLEAQVLAGVADAASRTFRLPYPDPGLVSAVTFPSDRGDVLVARWSATDPGRPERAWWVWDEPQRVVFVAEVDPSTLSPEHFRRYCEGLFVWDKAPILLRTLRLSYRNEGSNPKEIVGQGEYVQTERGIYSMGFTALATQDHAYIGVSLSRSIVIASLDPKLDNDALGPLPERFPPLRQRIARWSRDTLLNELGKGFGPTDRLLYYPWARDGILLGELVMRGPVSDAEVRRIVLGGFEDSSTRSGEIIAYRLESFLRALKSRNQLAVYAASIAAVLMDAPIHPIMEDSIMGRVSHAMEEQGIDFCQSAVNLLERGRFVRMGLYYLQAHGRSEDTLQKLERLSVRPELEPNRARALKAIAERLGVPAEER
jgi:hypothetical protein